MNHFSFQRRWSIFSPTPPAASPANFSSESHHNWHLAEYCPSSGDTCDNDLQFFAGDKVLFLRLRRGMILFSNFWKYLVIYSDIFKFLKIIGDILFYLKILKTKNHSLSTVVLQIIS